MPRRSLDTIVNDALDEALAIEVRRLFAKLLRANTTCSPQAYAEARRDFDEDLLAAMSWRAALRHSRSDNVAEKTRELLDRLPVRDPGATAA